MVFVRNQHSHIKKHTIGAQSFSSATIHSVPLKECLHVPFFSPLESINNAEFFYHCVIGDGVNNGQNG